MVLAHLRSLNPHHDYRREKKKKNDTAFCFEVKPFPAVLKVYYRK
jgi:hypothetical protein